MNTQTKQTRAVETEVVTDDIGMAQSVEFKFANGKRHVLTLSDLNPIIAAMAMAHGVKQKVGDAAAMSRNPDTGASATITEKYAAAMEVFERITSPDGTWNVVREGGSNLSLLVRALVRHFNGAKTADEVKVWLETKSAAEQTALRGNPKIAAIIADIQAERAKDVDSDALLDELAE